MKPRNAVLALLLLASGSPAWSAQVRLESVLGATDLTGFARAESVRPFVFPEDHGSHDRFRSEWWYLTASLSNAAGDLFGVQFTVFRQATAPASASASANPWMPTHLYLGHFAVTDVARSRHREAERLARGHPELAGARADPFAVWVDGWSLATAATNVMPNPAGGFGALQLAAATGDLQASLELVPLKPLVLQGDRGLSTKGPGQASYYYSATRLAVTGELLVDGARHRVEGLGWFDREWSTSLLSGDQAGWDWFGLHFDSGEDLMAFRLRRVDGVRDMYDHGMWVAADGTSQVLKADRFQLRPLRYWQDPEGVSWPVEWTITVQAPDGVREFRVVAAIEDQRMDTLLNYWEGLVRVLDDGGHPIGSGYMELTGYE